MKLRDFASYFRDEEAERESEVLEQARRFLDWSSCDYHAKFLDWLNREASKPIPVSGNHMDVVQAAVRANTLREIIQHLTRVGNDSQAAIRRASEANDD